MTDRIYLDHAATTPIIAPAGHAFARGMAAWSNPNSPHAEGRAARALLEEARETLKDALGWRHDVIFTSGASESVEMAGKRARVAGRAYGATEHAIVPFAMGEGATVIPVDADGLIDVAALDAVLAEGPALIAIQQVNNETGIVQDLDQLAPRIRDAGSLLLADCAQGASKMPLPDADFIAICGAQARRTARGRRAAGARSRVAEGVRRWAGEGLSARDAGCAGGAGLRRRAGR